MGSARRTDTRMSRETVVGLRWLYARADRACNSEGVNPADFFPPVSGRAAAHRAKKVCARCPYIHACLRIGLGVDESLGGAYGIWGGTVAHTRDKIAAQRRKAGKS